MMALERRSMNHQVFGISYQSVQNVKGEEGDHDYETLPGQQTDGYTYIELQDPALYYQLP